MEHLDTTEPEPVWSVNGLIGGALQAPAEGVKGIQKKGRDHHG